MFQTVAVRSRSSTEEATGASSRIHSCAEGVADATLSSAPTTATPGERL